MSDLKPAYRATVYAPRSVDPDEATPLEPRAGAVHSDEFKVATIQGVTGFQPYLGSPRGRRGSIDPIQKRPDTGALRLPLFDVRTTEGGSNAQRWVTAFLGDAAGRAQWHGLKVFVEKSWDAGGSWEPYFTGRIQDVGLDGRMWWGFDLRDMAEDLNTDVFVGVPHASITYAKAAPIYPTGLIDPYGDLPVLPPIRAKVGGIHSTAAIEVARLDINWADNPQLLDHNRILAAWPNAQLVTGGLRLVTDRTVRIVTKIVHDDSAPGAGREGEEGEFHFQEIFTSGAFNRAHGAWNGHFVFDSIAVNELDPSDADYLARPDVGDEVEFHVYIRRAPSEEWPLLIDDVHPAQMWQDLLDGKFGLLDSTGAALRKVAYDSTAFSTLIADTSITNARFILTSKERLNEWVEENICRAFNLTYRLDEQGQVVPFKFELPASTAGLPTITDADLSGSGAGGWDSSRSSVINEVEARYYVDGLIPPESITEAPPGLPEILPIRLTSKDVLIISADYSRLQAGEGKVEIDGIGYRTTPSERLNGSDRREIIERKIEDLIDRMKTPFVDGGKYAYLVCRKTANTEDVVEGDWVLVNVSVLPNPATNERGGTRLMRCVERTDEDPGIRLVLLDAGPDSAAVAPSLGTLALTTGDTQHSVDVPVTLNASGERVRLEYAVTETSEATRPDEASELWTFGDVGDATETVAIPRLPSGSRIWVRGRTEPAGGDGPKLPSAWVFPSNDKVDTTALTAPSGLSASGVTKTTADLSWTNGEADYPVEVLVVEGAAPGSWSDDDRRVTLGAGATGFEIRGLAGPSTQHTVGVRHRDEFGGVSAVATDTFSTGTTQPTAPTPLGIAPALVKITDNPSKYGAVPLQTAAAIALFPADRAYQIEVEWAPDSAGSPDTGSAESVGVVDGAEEVFIHPRPVAGVDNWYRIRHVREGAEPSAWTGWVLVTSSRFNYAYRGTGGPSGPAPSDPSLSNPVLAVSNLQAVN